MLHGLGTVDGLVEHEDGRHSFSQIAAFGKRSQHWRSSGWLSKRDWGAKFNKKIKGSRDDGYIALARTEPFTECMLSSIEQPDLGSSLYSYAKLFATLSLIVAVCHGHEGFSTTSQHLFANSYWLGQRCDAVVCQHHLWLVA